MSKRFSLIALAIILCAQTAHAGRQAGFDFQGLSAKGREAYQRLLTAGLFAVGGVGYAGQISENERALYDLMGEKEAVGALKSLVNDGSIEGGLYGLLGLSVTDIEAFNRAVDVYNSRKEFPERKTPYDGVSSRRDKVTTQNGCLISLEEREKIVSEIQAGHYDKLIRPKQ
jgi:hypothetical protein